MSYFVAQGTPLSYMTAWMGEMSLDQDTRIHKVESLYCPPETQNIVNKLYCNTKKVCFFFNKVCIVGMQEENQHSLQRKQGAGVRRKVTGSEGNYGHTCSFLKIYIYIEDWLIFSVH